jgi:hypothetical protein
VQVTGHRGGSVDDDVVVDEGVHDPDHVRLGEGGRVLDLDDPVHLAAPLVCRLLHLGTVGPVDGVVGEQLGELSLSL